MKIFKIVKTSIFFLLGISIFFLKNLYLEQLKYFIGALVIIYSLDDLFMAILKEEELEKSHFLYKAIAQLIIGLALLIFINQSEIVCVIWGIWAILREADELKECYLMIKEKTPCVLNIAESIVAIVLSVVMIMELESWEHHATVHLYLLIVELITAILFPEFRWVYKKIIKKESNEE